MQLTVDITDIPKDALQDKVILVTGAGSGIGRTLSLTIAKYGATVILLGKTISKLEAVYDEIEVASGPQPAIYPMNLSGARGEDYEELAHVIENNFGRLDGLVHNAADTPLLSPLHLFKPQLWAQVLQTNVTAPFLLTQALIPVLKQSSNTNIIFTVDEKSQQAYWHAYGVAKAALKAMMQIWADEWENQPNIYFNAIDPGIVRTSLRTRLFPGQNPNTFPVADTVMPYYLYLLANQTLNGQVIICNNHVS